MADIWVDDFESAAGATSLGGVTRTASNHSDTANGTVDTVAPADDYSTRTDGSTPAGLDFAFTGFTGSYWRAEDLDGLDNGFAGGDTDVINYTGIDITGQTTLVFEGLFAADSFADNGGASYRFEADDFIRVEVQIDGGGFVNILEFRGDQASGGLNGNMSVDTDANGVGDGMTLGRAAQLFTAAIAGTGNLLDLRITFSVDGSNEEIAFDDLKITDGMAAPIDGTPGADTLVGTSNADVINGLGANDRLLGGDGDDTINGGDGDDQLWGQDGADALDGGAGTDSAYFLLADAGVIIDLSGSGGVGGEAAGDTYTSIERFFGSNFADTMSGDSGVNNFFGLNGDDILIGNAGNDILSGGNDDDQLFGGADNDRLIGGNGEDTLNGDAGNDMLFGNAQNDTLDGGDGNDILQGGTGADSLNGGAGTDTVSYTTASAGVTVDLGTVGMGGDALGDTYTSIENVLGSQLGDNLTGDGGNNIINGLGGIDIIYGEDGNDILVGGAGDDLLNGGSGRDFLTGGAGSDTFEITDPDQGVIIIRDFQDGVDDISLIDFGNVDEFSDLLITQVGTSVHIREDVDNTGGSNDSLIVLVGTMAADITAADFSSILPPPPAVQEPWDDKTDDAVAQLLASVSDASSDNTAEGVDVFDIDMGFVDDCAVF